jgi:hypothetical protein
MNKKTRSIAVLFALAAGTLVTLASSPASPVKAASTESSAIYKITAVESDAAPLGCVVNCPTIKSNTPTFAVQNTIGTTVASASKIDTFSASAWDETTRAQKSYEGGCAIVGTGLKCWGDNSRGQLGDETSTSSLTTPVTATENGVALTGVTDLSTNGLTTCVVASGTLKCVGSGNWEGNYSKRYSLWGSTSTVAYPAGTESNRVSFNSNILQIYNSAGTEIYTKTDTNWIPDTLVSKNWSTFAGLGSNVAKVQVGSGNNNSSTPTICVLLTTGFAKCAVVTAGTQTSISDSITTEVRESDCDGLTTPVKYEVTGDWCSTEQIGIRTSFDRQYKNANGTLTSSATWTWADAGVTGAVDIAMPSDSWGASSICFAGPTTICRTFSAGEFGPKTDPIEGGENSQAVYMTSGWGPPGLCLYSNNTISCGAGTSTPTGTKMATKVTAVAVMAKPLNIFFGSNQSMQKLYFLLPTGILAADAWILTCSNCQSQSGSIVAPVTAFSASTSTDYTYAKSINGSTDSPDYIPMTIVSGDRKSRSSVAISVKTASGEILTGVSVRWTAPDAPGLLSSSASSTLATDETGSARTTVTSGPVTFTLSVPTVSTCPPMCTSGQSPTTSTTSTTVAGAAPAAAKPAGSLASGATLQAASITVIVPDTGTINITVPDAPAIVSRKVSVTLPDGTPVPNATVQLKNNYLTYAYQNSGTSTSTWSSRPKDTKGYLGQMNCAYCFVAPPKYATGVDGSVTFSSFNPSARSSAYDADVAYDDGELNQNVKKTFASTTETVQMPFMASIKVALPDADPATPAKEVDADPTTPETDIKTDSTGGVTIETDLVDEDKAPISGVSQSVETVNSGSSCEKGGLISSSDKVTSICANGGVSASSINKAASVRAMGVKTSAGCSATMTTKTGSNGKATLVVCPTTSTKYRIRGTGAIASKTICVRVNNVACGVSAASAPTNTPVVTTPAYVPTYTPPVVVSKVAVMKKGKVTSFTTINKTAKVKIPKGAKVALTVAAASKKFCSVSGTSVKAIKPGSCSISVKVTPKATAKVKKPKAVTTKIKITIKK